MSPLRDSDGQPGTPAVETMVARVVDHVDRPDALVRIHGRPGAGTTTTLYRAAEVLRQRGKVPLIVASSGGMDAAATAMIDAVDELAGDAAFFRDIDVPFETKLTRLVGQLTAREGEFVLLLDEPWRWDEPLPHDQRAAGSHGRLMIEKLVRNAPVPVVFTGRRITGVWSDCELSLEPDFEVAPLLDALDAGPLHDSVGALRAELATPTTRLSGSAIRAALLLHYLQGSDTRSRRRLMRDIQRDALTLHDLARMLQDQLAHPRTDQPVDVAPIAAAWDHFSVLRAPVPPAIRDALFDAAGVTDERTIAALTAGLLFEREDGRWDMHEQLRRSRDGYLAAQPWATRERVHATVARAYRDAQEFPTDGGSHGHLHALRNGMEAYFHLVHTDVRPETLDVHAYFADQLKLHGRERSLLGQRLWRSAGGHLSDEARAAFDDASSLFDLAVRHEPDDSYAIHYRGFNRDATATMPEAVLDDYRRAIELEPTAVWWHSRLCTHLQARGRRADARLTWARAIELCVDSDEAELAEHLHRWALRWALEFADLGFAREIVDSVRHAELPGDVREQFEAMQAWMDRLEAGASDRDVLPTSVGQDRLGVRSILFGDREVTSWTNARIQAVEPDLVVLRCAGPFTPGERPDEIPFDSTTIGMEELRERSRDTVGEAELVPGRFLEIAEVRGDGTRIKFFDDRAWRQPGLPPLFPDPLRYGDAWIRSTTPTT